MCVRAQTNRLSDPVNRYCMHCRIRAKSRHSFDCTPHHDLPARRYSARSRVDAIRHVRAGGQRGRISQGQRLKTEPNFCHYISAVFGGAPARYAKIVIYVPGCQFAAYDLDLESRSDITQQFRCDSLPTKTVQGFIRPDRVPSNTYLAEKKLDIAAYEDGDWVCRFFFQPQPKAPNIQGGSCLGSEIPLGTLGEIDPARDGNFEITIPDFTRDPEFDKFAERGKFGVIDLALREKKIGRVLATIKPEDGPERGLNVQKEYREPLIFTTGH